MVQISKGRIGIATISICNERLNKRGKDIVDVVKIIPLESSTTRKNNVIIFKLTSKTQIVHTKL